MDRKQLEEQIIEKYQNDEKMMILIFAQWCINHELEPVKLYQMAYPGQMKNHALEEAMELTVPKNEAEDIPNETVLNVLQLFGNDDLAFVVQSEIEKFK
ncbi:hypothetical protein H8S33_08930 [Ornithinibacillus sp. BX22]|uniref:YxiS n=2 Tax=Ornithinibacillus TaxID=484508 RepID=A0A923L5V3_9BACI|nr:MULTISPECIES: hypothetical protein [Ornithinibacillus]MBC5636940.1 hypothetical protein [Ornithinibacillus hominis]MBS3681506.1 hypothetical protein [Ornithinibacillus massiliensis]